MLRILTFTLASTALAFDPSDPDGDGHGAPPEGGGGGEGGTCPQTCNPQISCFHPQVMFQGHELNGGECVLGNIDSLCDPTYLQFDSDTKVCTYPCPSPSQWDGSQCSVHNDVCDIHTQWNGTHCNANELSTHCGTGTQWNGTHCVPASYLCSTGTQLDGSNCVLDTHICGDDTTMHNSKCVATENACGQNTFFDATCRSLDQGSANCGAGTEWDETKCIWNENTCGDTILSNGKCVPNLSQVCGLNTISDGKCTAQTTQCGTGTKLQGSTCQPDFDAVSKTLILQEFRTRNYC